MKKTNKKGFTIVELVIVIAVIAILAAVLIPNISRLVKKANESSDITLTKNMNTLLAMDEAENGKATDMYDVLIALENGGFKLDKLNPRATGNVFAWDKENNQMVYLSKTGNVLFQSKDFTNKGSLFITTRDADTFKTFEGYSYYLVQDLSTDVTLKEGSSLDTGEYKLTGNVACQTTGDVVIRGTIQGTLTVNSTQGKIVNYSVVENVVIQNTASTSYHEKGQVKSFTIEDSLTGKVVFEQEAYVEKLTQKNTKTSSSVVNNGYIQAVTAPATDVKNPISKTEAKDYALVIKTFEDLANFRDKVNAGATYAGMTVKLEADIDISGRAWTPIGAAFRDNLSVDSKVFQGTFDGGNHTISGLTNTGFRISSTYCNSNSTTPQGYKEYVFGLFGSVYNAKITNLKMSNVNIDLVCDDKDKVLGDSVGAVVGFVGGTDSKVTSCSVLSGKISGFDATAGVIGRIYADKAEVSGCINAATVTSARRAAGIIGFVSNKEITVSNCENKGSITCLNNEVALGIQKDLDGDKDRNENVSYHHAAGIAHLQTSQTTPIGAGNSNSGAVKNESKINGVLAAQIFVLGGKDKQ